jgi:hypothetical protein
MTNEDKGIPHAVLGYKFFMNKEKTVAVEIWYASGTMYVKTRETPDDIWSPPVPVEEVNE